MMLFKEEFKKLQRDFSQSIPLIAKFLNLYFDSVQSALAIEVISTKGGRKYWITRYTSSVDKAKERWETIKNLLKEEKIYHADWLTAQLALNGIRAIRIIPWHHSNPILTIEFPTPQTAKEILKTFEKLKSLK